MPDRRSSLAFDDLDFTPDLGTNPVASMARYPVMTGSAGPLGVAAGRKNQPCVAGLTMSLRH